MRIILASGSPRRKELMEKAGLSFEIDPPDIDERKIVEKSAKKLVEILAIKKAEEVAKRHPDSIIIGSDLIVSYLDKQIGKPENAEGAKEILQTLCNKTHQVITGVAVINTVNGKKVSEVGVANVTMNNYSVQEIEEYVATGEPLDKGGAYAIQGLGRNLIEKFDGDPETIIGLPTKILMRLIDEVK